MSKVARQPWGVSFGRKERASQIRLYPVQELVSALGHCEAARGRVLALSRGEIRSDEIASHYVRRTGATRNVVAEVFERAAKSGAQDPRMMFALVAAEVVTVNAPVGSNDPMRWPNATTYPRAAAMLTLVGAGRCIAGVTRQPGDIDHRGRPALNGGMDLCGEPKFNERSSRWCADHFHEGRSLDRNDREAITGLLHAVGAGLPSPIAA